jgi:4a-hydroxytetrahydrobiopterin dehydratase
MTLSQEQIQEKLNAIRGWIFVDGQVQKTFSFPDFQKSMDFVNKLGVIVEGLNHHPDIHIRYTKVTVATSTHDEDGITDIDFKLAKACDQLAVDML